EIGAVVGFAHAERGGSAASRRREGAFDGRGMMADNRCIVTAGAAHAVLSLGQVLPSVVRGGVDGRRVLSAADPGQPRRGRGTSRSARAPGADGAAALPL